MDDRAVTRTAASIEPAEVPAAPTAAQPTAAASDDLLALENQVCFALAVAARGVIGLYRPMLEPLGLPLPSLR